ncbi:MAG: oligopeptide transporter, OPT family [Gammaproteobacteria bacterium]|nr:oligopeptide transporter, OPT family [Gammaproteobacteria bacterium]
MKNELTWRCVVLSILLTLLLAMSNAYLALKLGILTSASIPAAIISMGVLRLFKKANVLEHNLVQTAASAGEAIAGGIVYTIPALIIIGYWHHFDYLTNVLIALSGGILGVLFSIPLRRILVNDANLAFPEGKAIAEVLISSKESIGLMDIVYGGILGGLLEFAQMALKVLASGWTLWFTIKRYIVCLGLGFSATMIGAGYLVGFDMACSIGLGAVIAWFLALPALSAVYPHFLMTAPPAIAGPELWNQELRYLGIGAMLFAGIWTLFSLIKPLARSMRISLQGMKKSATHAKTDQDLPLTVLIIGTVVMTVVLIALLNHILPIHQMGFADSFSLSITLTVVVYIVVVGFIFSVITAYFSGMVGVTASPGSSVVIAGILFAAWMLLSLMTSVLPLPLDTSQIAAAQAVVIVIASVVTGIAAIANDNSQDLKVGQLVGATPWKQQLMLLLGVVISALVIPPVMQLLFDVYGIAGVMPHPGMDMSKSLPAPTAAMLAALTNAVFSHGLPWSVMCGGAFVILALIALQKLFKFDRVWHLSLLGVAIGMYLPITTSMGLFLGGMIAKLAECRLEKNNQDPMKTFVRKQIGTRVACGLVAGSALMDVFLTIPFSIQRSPDALRVVSEVWEQHMGVVLSVIMTVILGMWMIRRVLRSEV